MLKDFCVKPGNAVDGKAGCNRHVSHLHLSVVNNGHFAQLLLVARIHGLNLVLEPAVDFLHNLVNSGQKP